jgi:anti-anti-sigma factor
MSATVEFEGNVARIILGGKLDFSTQGDIKKSMDEALEADHVTEIQVDLADVAFMDSSVIRALLALQTKALRGRKSVALLNCSEMLREIFTIGGFDGIFTIR